MRDVYDNGAVMLGNINDVIAEIEREMRENIDMIFCDMEDLLKDMKELQEVDRDMIVAINYENPMGYDYTCWDANDKVEVRK